MALPIKNGKITNPYGIKGNLWSSGRHQGADFATPTGTPLLSVSDGTVVGVGQCWGPAFGNHQVIVHYVVNKLNYWAIYAHCSADFVKVGQKVKMGDKIALSGAEGNVTGPHLHFEVHTVDRWDKKTDINPQFLFDLKSASKEVALKKAATAKKVTPTVREITSALKSKNIKSE